MKLNINGSWIIDFFDKPNKDKKGNILMVYAKFTDFVKDNFGGI